MSLLSPPENAGMASWKKVRNAIVEEQQVAQGTGVATPQLANSTPGLYVMIQTMHVAGIVNLPVPLPSVDLPWTLLAILLNIAQATLRLVLPM